MIKDIGTSLSTVIHFITTDIWRISLKDLPRKKSFFVKQFRTGLLAIRGFEEDKCLLSAASLTYYSLLSVVPVFAMAFGIAKGFGFEKLLERQLFEKLPGQETVLLKVVDFAKRLLENTQGGMIAGIGIIVLLWSAIKLLGRIERSFNEIWQVRQSRTVARKFSDYLSIMLISPVFMVVSSSVTVFVTTQIAHITEKISLLSMFGPLIMWALKMLPYCLIGLLLTIIYILMPNTKVNVKSGLVAGMIAGTAFVMLQWGYINFQVGIAKYNAIYGSFAALPLFLIWLQLSWLIVLFGAEISFAIQNVDTYKFEQDYKGISPAFKKLLSLQIACLSIQAFSRGENPLTASQVSNKLEISVSLARQLLYELVDCGIISDTSSDEPKEAAYQPARDINMLTVKYVIEALERRGTDNISVAQSRELTALSDTLKVFGDTIEASPANKLLKDI